MANVDELLDAFIEEDKLESSRTEMPPQIVETTCPPRGDDGGSCLLAVKAAMGTLNEYCGMDGIPITLAGITVRVPISVLKITQMKDILSHEDLAEAIRESTWMKDLSGGLCAEMRGLAADTPEHEKCAAALGERLSEELVK